MSDGDSAPAREDIASDAPLPNRFSRGTLTGCVGILCVLTLPALLFVPIEEFNVPGWIQRLIPLLGVTVVVAGAWLLSRVPTASTPRSGEPDHPVTRSGRAPVLERPATTANRAALVVSAALAICCAGGYALVSTAGGARPVVAGTLLSYLAGMLLLGNSLLAMANRTPAPAWRWERVYIARNNARTQAVPFACAGIVSVLWSLFVASEQGYIWAPLGVGVMLLAGALTGPILLRLPERGKRAPSPPASRRDLPESDRG